MNEPLPVVFERRAARELEEIVVWWRKNRPSSPDLFVAELEGMLAVVALMPSLGVPARSERARDVRRVLLNKTKYHVYYRVRLGTLAVLSVWHAARGQGPGV
jgi:plasmid stabilization system protein ParE